jgi:signal transduction histidine kinase
MQEAKIAHDTRVEPWRRVIRRQDFSEDIFHDLQIRAQALLSTAESLEDLLDTLMDTNRFPEIRKKARLVKMKTWELSSVLQSYQGGSYVSESPKSGVRLDNLIRDAALTFEDEARRRGIELDLHGVQPLWITVPEQHMRVLFNNVFQNAVKYSFAGREDRERRRNVTVSLRVEGGKAEIRVANYGVGVPEEEMERIFEPGFRGRKARSEGRTGAGMGLFTARRIARALGGDVKIASALVGGGVDPPALTIVTITLRIQSAE